MTNWLVALDFGTTATAVAVRPNDGGAARAVAFADGSLTMPSAVFAEPDGRLIVGAEANNEAELGLDAFEPTPKRRVGDGQIRLGATSFDVAEIIGAVMAPAIAEAVQQNNNTSPAEIVLTHPVSWRAQRRSVLADALKAAEGRLDLQLPEPQFVAEPIAAAQWYSLTDPARPGAYYAVYDLGGGTFDTTVLQATDEGFEVIASGGIDPLGGFDFDAALFNYLGTEYVAPADPELWKGLALPDQPDLELARQRRRLQQSVGLLKLGLSTSPDKRIQLPGVTSPVVVTRGEYEALIAGHIERTVRELEDTIADAGLSPEKLTAIYRIGGAARTPLVGAALDRLRVPVKVLDQPKLVVAQGAATLPEKAGTHHAPPSPTEHATPQHPKIDTESTRTNPAAGRPPPEAQPLSTSRRSLPRWMLPVAVLAVVLAVWLAVYQRPSRTAGSEKELTPPAAAPAPTSQEVVTPTGSGQIPSAATPSAPLANPPTSQPEPSAAPSTSAAPAPVQFSAADQQFLTNLQRAGISVPTGDAAEYAIEKGHAACDHTASHPDAVVGSMVLDNWIASTTIYGAYAAQFALYSAEAYCPQNVGSNY